MDFPVTWRSDLDGCLSACLVRYRERYIQRQERFRLRNEQFMQGIARSTLNYWAVEGYVDMIVREVSPAAVMPVSAALAGVGVALVGVGFLLMRVRVREALG